MSNVPSKLRGPQSENSCWSIATHQSQTFANKRHLHSASRHHLTVPHYRLSTFGRRVFSVTGPTVWNSLLDSLRDPALSSSDRFRQLLKTNLFWRYHWVHTAQHRCFMTLCYINLWLTLTYFGVSGTFCSGLIGQHQSDKSRDLATSTFDLGGHGSCRCCVFSCSVCVPSLNFVGLPIRKILGIYCVSINPPGDLDPVSYTHLTLPTIYSV